MEAFIQMFSKLGWLSDWISNMNFTAHYKHFQRGLISLPGIAYFLSTMALGLFFAQMLIHNKRK